MKISQLVKTLLEIRKEYGDLSVVGGYLNDDTAPSKVCVIEKDGMEIWPNNPNGLDMSKVKVDGVFIT